MAKYNSYISLNSNIVQFSRPTHFHFTDEARTFHLIILAKVNTSEATYSHTTYYAELPSHFMFMLGNAVFKYDRICNLGPIERKLLDVVSLCNNYYICRYNTPRCI